MATHKNILLVGYGNLAKSIINEDIQKKYKIFFVNSSKIIKPINSNKKNIEKFDIIFLLVKPNIFYKHGNEFSKYINKSTIIISFMAGVKTSTISNKIQSPKIVRLMPSVLAKYKVSHTCIYSNHKNLSNWTAKNIANFLGKSFILDKENDIHKATVIFGSGPAFIAYIIQSYINACKQINFKYLKSADPVLDMFIFVIKYIDEFGGLDNFIKSISSKKGITQEGINQLAKADLKKIIHSSFIKSYQRSLELSIEK